MDGMSEGEHRIRRGELRWQQVLERYGTGEAGVAAVVTPVAVATSSSTGGVAAAVVTPAAVVASSSMEGTAAAVVTPAAAAASAMGGAVVAKFMACTGVVFVSGDRNGLPGTRTREPSMGSFSARCLQGSPAAHVIRLLRVVLPSAGG
jgi:hypothetical protein